MLRGWAAGAVVCPGNARFRAYPIISQYRVLSPKRGEQEK